MPKTLDDTRIVLDLEEARGLRTAGLRRLQGQGQSLWRRILEWIDCRFHFWRRLPFCMQPQLQDKWCWAASAASAACFYNSASTWTQCALADAELPGPDTCCQDGSTPECDQEWTLQDALTRTGHFASYSNVIPTRAQIRSEILNGRPLGARTQWDDGSGHFVMIVGYRCDAAGHLDLRDSLYGSWDLPVAEFSTSYLGEGLWTHTYYTEA
jgi:hypothetical protein